MKSLKAFRVSAAVKGAALGKLFGSKANGFVGAEVMVINHPNEVTINLLAEPKDGISPLAVYCGEPHESATNFSFTVPIEWTDSGPAVPDWRGETNFANVVLFDGDLRFTDVQISLVVRGESLYLLAQRVYEGWVREQDDGIVFIPSAPEFARPGLDYRQLWQARGQALAIVGSIASQLSKQLGCPLPMPEAAEWEPAPKSESQRLLARIAHFNPITDSGLAISAKGTEYQLLGNRLEGFKGPVMVPAPGTVVQLKTAARQPGYQRTLAVECRPA